MTYYRLKTFFVQRPLFFTLLMLPFFMILPTAVTGNEPLPNVYVCGQSINTAADVCPVSYFASYLNEPEESNVSNSSMTWTLAPFEVERNLLNSLDAFDRWESRCWQTNNLACKQQAHSEIQKNIIDPSAGFILQQLSNTDSGENYYQLIRLGEEGTVASCCCGTTCATVSLGCVFFAMAFSVFPAETLCLSGLMLGVYLSLGAIVSLESRTKPTPSAPKKTWSSFRAFFKKK